MLELLRTLQFGGFSILKGAESLLVVCFCGIVPQNSAHSFFNPVFSITLQTIHYLIINLFLFKQTSMDSVPCHRALSNRVT